MTTITAEAKANAAETIATFQAKAEQVAAANGWTLDHAKNVMLRFLRDTDPEVAAIIVASALVTA